MDASRPGTTPWVPLLTLVGAGAQTALWLQELWEGLNIAIFPKEGKRWIRVHYGGMAPPPCFTTAPFLQPTSKFEAGTDRVEIS